MIATQYNPRTRSRGIEWTDETRNPTGGCFHDCQWRMPDGTIAICYAKELAERGVAKNAYPKGFEHHYFRPSMLRELARGQEPRLVFCDSMSDMFAPNVPAEQVIAILNAMRTAPHHAYQSLTKAAPQLLKYTEYLPSNLWVGVSSPPDRFKKRWLSQRQQANMLKRSLEVMAEVKRRTGNIVWLSAEPVSWDLTTVIDAGHPLDWIVIGAASRGSKFFQPNPDHIANLLCVMDATETPVFFKGNIRSLFVTHDFAEPALNRWREDFPRMYRNGEPIPAVVRRQRNCRKFGWTVNRIRIRTSR